MELFNRWLGYVVEVEVFDFWFEEVRLLLICLIIYWFLIILLFIVEEGLRDGSMFWLELVGFES